ncbi:MAG: outer membrane lipoprotein carrier protein LolA, partial [Steroidobacterales bacterium]
SQRPRASERRLQPLRRAVAGMVFLLAVGGAAAATAGTDTALDRYLNGMSSLRIAFTQTVTDARGIQTETGAGTLLVARPGRFRWDYQPRADAAAATAATAGTSDTSGQRGQLLVADGKNLWFYDRELAQVSVKPVAAALSATPVMLLSGSATQLHESFDISAAASHDGLDWVSVKPRSAEADFSHAELGFARERLARMVVTDRLGQTVRLDFSHGERNARIEPSDLQFKPPADVDVIGTPQS